jgi:hypothetical protein
MFAAFHQSLESMISVNRIKFLIKTMRFVSMNFQSFYLLNLLREDPIFLVFLVDSVDMIFDGASQLLACRSSQEISGNVIA